MTPEPDVTVDAPRTLSVEVTHAECFPIEPHLMWLLIGRFEDLSWLPGLTSFGWEGRIRRFSIAGRQFTERLDFLDAAARAYGYSLIDGPLAVTRYEAQITIHDDPAGCRVVMESSCDPAPGSESEIRHLLESTYAAAMRGLRRYSERVSRQAIASSQPSKSLKRNDTA